MVNEFAGQTFGQALRALRMEKNVTLRDMARRLDLTPTYLSQVEQDKFSPPTEDRIKQMGQILDLPQEQVDQLVAMAGRVPQDLHDVLDEHPHEMASFLRTARGLTAGDIRQLTEEAEKLKNKDG
jgi:HTH-type transcriptional regulator, competence development regulator